MSHRHAAPVRPSVEVLESRNLPSSVTLAHHVVHQTTNTHESDLSGSAIVRTAQTDAGATGSNSSVTTTTNQAPARSDDSASVPSPTGATASGSSSPASTDDSSDDGRESQTSTAASQPPSGSTSTSEADDGSESQSAAPQPPSGSTSTSEADDGSESQSAAPQPPSGSTSTPGTDDGSESQSAAPQPPSGSTTPPGTDDSGESQSASTPPPTQVSPTPPAPSQGNNGGTTTGTPAPTGSDGSGVAQSPVVPTTPPASSGSPGQTASNGPTGSPAAPASSPPSQTEGPAAPAQPATTVVAESGTGAVRTSDSQANVAAAGAAGADLRVSSPAGARAAPLTTWNTDPSSLQGDRTGLTLLGLANGRTGGDPVTPLLTWSSGPQAEGGRLFQAADAGDGQVPLSLSQRRGEGAPAQAALLQDVFPFDADDMEVAMRDFFASLNDVGTVLSGWPANAGLYYWLLSAAAVGVAGAAWTLGRRRRGAASNDPAGVSLGELGDVFPWEPDEDGNPEDMLS
jgi:hypothetical protein